MDVLFQSKRSKAYRSEVQIFHRLDIEFCQFLLLSVSDCRRFNYNSISNVQILRLKIFTCILSLLKNTEVLKKRPGLNVFIICFNCPRST